MPTLIARHIFTIFILSFFLTINFTHGKAGYEFVRTINQKFGEEKLTHFRFFWHDIIGGPNPTSITVVESATKVPYAFGYVNMIDNPLTVGPESTSKIVGKAQGFYALAAQDDFALLMTMNFVLFEGKYSGSTIAILGRNPVSEKVREMPVIGGSGLFRFARGYALIETNSSDPNTRDATVEYNIYVTHYEGIDQDDN